MSCFKELTRKYVFYSAISKLNVEYRKITKDSNKLQDSPQSSGSTMMSDFTNLPSLPHKK